MKEVTGTALVSYKLLVDLTGVPNLVPLESIEVDQVHLGSRVRVC